jgi:acetyl esterase/lipase
MPAMTRMSRLALLSTFAAAAVAAILPDIFAQEAPSPPAVVEDTTSLGADGTARITRVVPVPTTISPEARAFLATGAAWAPAAGSEEQRRLIEKAQSLYPVRIEDSVIAGVPVRIVTPPTVPPQRADRVLVNLHGGGFVTDSGSMLESIPIASLTRTKVVTVLYRLAPASKFPAAVDDTIAVYRELLKTNKPQRVVLYGTSAGAILSAQAAVRMRREGLPLPAAIGFFTGFADFANPGDSLAFFGVPGLDGARPPDRSGSHDALYLGVRDPLDPLVSPIYSDLAGWPPTLCVSGTRDLLLSGTVNFHRALLRKGVDARLVVFDAMPHAHWYMVGIPEATEALELMARFFDEQLGR